MSGMIKVKNPAEPTFVLNKLVQSFNPDEYYATQSHFDAVCGTSEVKLFSAQALKQHINIHRSATTMRRRINSAQI